MSSRTITIIIQPVHCRPAPTPLQDESTRTNRLVLGFSTMSSLHIGNGLADHREVCIYVDTLRLQSQFSTTQTVTTSRLPGTIDQGWPVDIGKLKSAILSCTGLESRSLDVSVNLYGPTPPSTDTIWHPVAGHSLKLRTLYPDATSGHLPRADLEILIDSISTAWDKSHKETRAEFVFVSDEVDPAVPKIAKHGFNVHICWWRAYLRKDYEDDRAHFQICAIDDFLDPIVHNRGT